MRIVPVPCLKDNYAYLLIAEGGEAAVVDVSEAAPVLAALEREGARAVAILSTHHHMDHVGGNQELLARYPGIPVYGHAYDQEHGRIPGQTVALRGEGEGFTVLGAQVEALYIPGHTLGAVAYHFPEEGVVFTGDTLFQAGCGRLFEGTAPMMHRSLQRLARLPPETRVYCGHEYAASNLRFAQAVEPESEAVARRAEKVGAQRAAGQPSVPTTLQEELDTNPFLRPQVPAVRQAAQREGLQAAPAQRIEDVSDEEVFRALRNWKDRF